MKGLFNKGFNKYINDLANDKNEVDNYIAISECFSYIIILNIDIFYILIIFEISRKSKINFIVIE